MGSDNKTLELQIRIAAEDAARIVSSLKGDIQTLASEAKKFSGNEGAALGKSFKEAEAAAKDSAASINDIKKAIGSLAEVVALTKALSLIKDMGSFALQTADNFQTMKNQFGTLLGDMEAGAGLFNEIKAFNDKTPFDMSTLTQATNVLIAAKVPLQDLQAQLTKFGDLSQGNSQKMTSYVNAFSMAAAKGKADMQVLNTYLHQGVPILDELAKNFNVTTAEIVQMSSDGKISFKDFSKALDDLTASGGQYFGGMELASKSLAAMQEGLKEATNSLAASFGDILLPAAVDVTGILTDITNAINENPILKGLLAGAIIAVTAVMGIMAVKAAALAVKTWLAQAAQMSLNASLAITNPLLWAGIAAAAAATAGYVFYASSQQKAARATEDNAYATRKLKDAIDDAKNAAYEFYQNMQNIGLEGVLYHIDDLQKKIADLKRNGVAIKTTEEVTNFRSAMQQLKKLSDDFINDNFESDTDRKILELKQKIEKARAFIKDYNIDGIVIDYEIPKEDKEKLQQIISYAEKEIEKLSGSINEKAHKWKEDWAQIWNKYNADLKNDPFYDIETERINKLKEAAANYIDEEDEAIRQVNEYYAAKKGEIIKKLADDEKRIQADLSKSKIDNLEYEYQKALDEINKLEAQRLIAAEDSAEEIAEIQKNLDGMRDKLKINLEVDIKKATLDEARDTVKNWQEELSDNLLIGIINLKRFSDEAAVILSDLTAQLTELASSAALSGFEEFGRALGEGEDAADSMRRALFEMSSQILKQLPLMFLQAGLQLIANGQWPIGLGFVAAAGSTALISGYMDGTTKHAKGGVFDEYGQAAREFAAGGAFTNQIVSTPTYFAHGGGLGVMGEAGPEAIMPLTRMPNGNLGVQTAGGGTNVTVNIINNSGAEVQQEETETADGGRRIDITIGDMINKHISSGKADRTMSRYGLRAVGV
jgi:tape measure domain-containing protein